MEHINRIKAAAVGVLGCLTALWGWFGWLVVAWIGCMVLDYATGSAAALRSGEWSSKIARDGLWHKLGSMVAVLVAAILDGVIRLALAHIPALDPHRAGLRGGKRGSPGGACPRLAGPHAGRPGERRGQDGLRHGRGRGGMRTAGPYPTRLRKGSPRR